MEDDNQTDLQNQNNDSSLNKLQQDLEDAMNGWKRAAADFENYKRRKESENKELVEFAREVTVAKLLPALDSLEQALKHMPAYTPTTSNFAKASSDKPSAPQTPLLEKEGSSALSSSTNAEPLPLSKTPTAASGPRGSTREAEEGVGAIDFAKKYHNWQTGVNGIIIQLDKTLVELGVKKIEAKGKKFDPHFHEAVREVESEADDGIVVDELQTGFELNGKVIRPSQVVISKKVVSE